MSFHCCSSKSHAGGASLHLCMTPHGPDTATYEAAIDDESASQPQRLPDSTLAFMFEVSATPRVAAQALGSPCIDQDYYQCWKGLKSHFTGSPAPPPRPAGAGVGAEAGGGEGTGGINGRVLPERDGPADGGGPDQLAS
jgi:homogentisate 1,2-dioxygenase